MLKLVSQITMAYLRGNRLPAAELPSLVSAVYRALVEASTPPALQPDVVPAVPIKKSVRPDAIVCLECGRNQKMLKRHLATAHGLTVDDYRAKWSLPANYPVVAPDYAGRRSELAKAIGLGRKKGTKVPERSSEQSGPGNGKPAHKYPASRWAKKEG